MINPPQKQLNIELVRSFHRVRVDRDYNCRSRDSDALIFYIKGSQQFFFPRFSLTASEGEVLYLPYASAYRNRILDPETEYYQIDFLIHKEDRTTPLFDGPQLIQKPESLNYYDCIQRIRHDNYMIGESYFFSCFSDLCKIIEMILKHDEADNNPVLSRIKPSVDYIDRNYQRNTSIAEIAAMSSTCTTNLERLFKICFQMTPNMYRNVVRVNKSKQLLLAGYGIVETAEKVGFYDSGHFSRIFKRIVGISPGEYGKSGRQK